jgi:hypothetical protein
LKSSSTLLDRLLDDEACRGLVVDMIEPEAAFLSLVSEPNGLARASWE